MDRDVWGVILSFCCPESIRSLSRTSKFFLAIISNNAFLNIKRLIHRNRDREFTKHLLQEEGTVIIHQHSLRRSKLSLLASIISPSPILLVIPQDHHLTIVEDLKDTKWKDLIRIPYRSNKLSPQMKEKCLDDEKHIKEYLKDKNIVHKLLLNTMQVERILNLITLFDRGYVIFESSKTSGIEILLKIIKVSNTNPNIKLTCVTRSESDIVKVLIQPILSSYKYNIKDSNKYILRKWVRKIISEKYI